MTETQLAAGSRFDDARAIGTTAGAVLHIGLWRALTKAVMFVRLMCRTREVEAVLVRRLHQREVSSRYCAGCHRFWPCPERQWADWMIRRSSPFREMSPQ